MITHYSNCDLFIGWLYTPPPFLRASHKSLFFLSCQTTPKAPSKALWHHYVYPQQTLGFLDEWPWIIQQKLLACGGEPRWWPKIVSRTFWQLKKVCWWQHLDVPKVRIANMSLWEIMMLTMFASGAGQVFWTNLKVCGLVFLKARISN